MLVFPEGARAGGATPGHAPGSRELGVLSPTHLAGDVHAFVLSGGSAFGLATADGVMAALAEAGLGFPTSAGPVPIVPAAILFDLPVAQARPDSRSGRAAAQEALAGGAAVVEGRVGAGAGARVGKVTGEAVPGGVGSAARVVGELRVGALAAVNAFGCVRAASDGRWIPGPPSVEPVSVPLGTEARGNTSLACVVTDAPLSRPQCTILAQMAVAGLARAVRPVFTPFDGDTILAAATGRGEPVDPVLLMLLGEAAAAALEEACGRAVEHLVRS